LERKGKELEGSGRKRRRTTQGPRENLPAKIEAKIECSLCGCSSVVWPWNFPFEVGFVEKSRIDKIDPSYNNNLYYLTTILI
jgi:hypothetical protein